MYKRQGLDSVTLSGTRAEGWYLDEARAAMEAGRIAYAGKYSAPDYETILASGCGLAIENTMIYHTPVSYTHLRQSQCWPDPNIRGPPPSGGAAWRAHGR